MTVETLEQKLKELSEENLEANNLIMHYTAEIDDLEFELGQSNRVIKEQQAEIEQLRFDAMLLYASGLACEQVKAENDELKKQVDGQQAEIKQLTEENKELEESCDLFKEFNTKHCERIAELQKKVEELEAKNAHLDSENTRLICEMDRMLDEGWDIMDKEADGWYKKGRKDMAKELIEEIDKVKEIFPNDIVGYEQAQGWCMCIDKLKEIAKERYGVEVD